MSMKFEEHIGIYENAFSKEYCESVIEAYEKMISLGFGVSRRQLDKVPKALKEDTSVFLNPYMPLNECSKELMIEFHDTLWKKVYPEYANKYWSLNDLAPHSSYCYKIQKTLPGEGYHIWHSESCDLETCRRVLVWTLYLNDVEEGGETEFIYQHFRVKPKQGTMMIWPAAYTHTHRGNPPLQGEKYIVTGWIQF